MYIRIYFQNPIIEIRAWLSLRPPDPRRKRLATRFEKMDFGNFSRLRIIFSTEKPSSQELGFSYSQQFRFYNPSPCLNSLGVLPNLRLNERVKFLGF